VPQQTLQQEKTSISIARDGRLYLASERLDLSQLAARLKEFGAQQPVIIRADSNTGYKRVVEVMDACQAAAVSRVSLATVTAQ
jgi:biopolymer transport protein ExbD